MKETKKDKERKEQQEQQERIDKLRTTMNQRRQDADEKYNFQKGFVNNLREQAEQALMGENDDSNLKDEFI